MKNLSAHTSNLARNLVLWPFMASNNGERQVATNGLVEQARQTRTLAAYRIREARALLDEARALRAKIFLIRSVIQETRTVNAEHDWRLRQAVGHAVAGLDYAEEICLRLRTEFGLN
jgi:hypothetical protein